MDRQTDKRVAEGCLTTAQPDRCNRRSSIFSRAVNTRLAFVQAYLHAAMTFLSRQRFREDAKCDSCRK